jgi:hypothetical protein
MGLMTLHEAIKVILHEHGCAMTTQAIADELNRCRLYSKGDGSAISVYQVLGRTSHCSDIFTREGSRVGLREWRGASPGISRPSQPAPLAPAESAAKDSEYIICLCDAVLGVTALREHRFDFLLGDANTPLPVDAYYRSLKLVIEYHERQHTEPVNFFDKPDQLTVSRVPRGEQRAIYDQRRRDVLPRHGVELIELSYSDFANDDRKRLLRDRESDIEVIRKKLSRFLWWHDTRYFGLSERYWMNLQVRYDLEVEKDRLAGRLEQMACVFGGSAIETHMSE